MDLISSLPHQTLVMCEESLRLAIKSQSGTLQASLLFLQKPNQQSFTKQPHRCSVVQVMSTMKSAVTRKTGSSANTNPSMHSVWVRRVTLVVRREVMSDEFKKLVGNDEVKIEDHVRIRLSSWLFDNNEKTKRRLQNFVV
ncbi:unnamed protein product [Brassica oleracea]|uniref:(rape) hypothetical protein n=1 Tax=Brassica napus TaxID=3708 RepID=A0A816I016_BRANA|nr:unnamed protein product [Brassica napus]